MNEISTNVCGNVDDDERGRKKIICSILIVLLLCNVN